RLVDMGVAPFLVSSSVNCIVAQRLLRKVCTGCRDPLEPHEELLKELQLTAADVKGKQMYRAKGCHDCHGTGYRGRTGVYEVFSLSQRLRKMVLDRNSTAELKKAAMEEGMLTLRRDALRKMLLGDTSPEEVLRETAPD